MASKASSIACPLSSPKSHSPQARRATLIDINPVLTCVLCGGYFIDATTIIECLHSFCKSCIVRYLETSTSCPICDAQLHKTKPLLSIRSDKTLQDIVYKLVPGLFKNEMKKRKEFFSLHPEAVDCCTAEERGETGDHKMFYTPQDKISLSLEYGFGDNQVPTNGYNLSKQLSDRSDLRTNRRYLLCPAGMKIALLKKFVMMKYDLPAHYQVEIMYLEDVLSDEYNLMDVAYIFSWRRNNPMRLFYRVSERPEKQTSAAHLETETVPFDVEAKNNRQIKKTMPSLPSSSSSSTTASAEMICAPLTAAKTADVAVNKQSVNCAKGAPKKKSCSTSTMTDTNRALSARESKAIMANGLSPTSANTKLKPTYVSGSVQTEEPPRKLRKILPANSSVPIRSPVNSAPVSSLPKVTCNETKRSSPTSLSSSYRVANNKRKEPSSTSMASPLKPSDCQTNNSRKYTTSFNASDARSGNYKCEKIARVERSERVFGKSEKVNHNRVESAKNNQKTSAEKLDSTKKASSVLSTLPTSKATSSVPKTSCNDTTTTTKTNSTVATLRNVRVTSEGRKVSSLMISTAKAASSDSASPSSRLSPPRSQTLPAAGFADNRKLDENAENSEKNCVADKSDNVNSTASISKSSQKLNESKDGLAANAVKPPASSVCSSSSGGSSSASVTATGATPTTTTTSKESSQFASAVNAASAANAKSIVNSPVVEERKVPSLKICTSKANESAAALTAVVSSATAASPRRQSPPSSQALNNCDHNCSSKGERSEKCSKDLAANNRSATKQSDVEPKKLLKGANVHSIIEYLQESKKSPPKSPKSPKSPTSGSNSSSNCYTNSGEIGVNFHSSVTSKGITIVRDVNRSSVASSSAATMPSSSSAPTPVSLVDSRNSSISLTPITSSSTPTSSKKTVCHTTIEKVCLPLKIPKVSSNLQAAANANNCKSTAADAKVTKNCVDSKPVESVDEKSIASSSTDSTPLATHPLTPSPSTCDSINDSSSLPSPVKDNIGALDLSFGNRSKTASAARIASEKQKHVANPPVLDKHRFLCPPHKPVSLYTAPSKHPSFKISSIRTPVARPSIGVSSAASAMPSAAAPASKKEQTICGASAGENAASAALASNANSRSNHHHHHHHHHHRKSQSNLTVITPDPHSQHPKIVIKNLDPR